MKHYFYLCFVFVMLSLLFIAASFPLAGKGLTYWLLFVMLNCVLWKWRQCFVNFPCGILGQVWYLMVSIPGRCRLSNILIQIKELEKNPSQDRVKSVNLDTGHFPLIKTWGTVDCFRAQFLFIAAMWSPAWK